jgi:hypothetical protein
MIKYQLVESSISSEAGACHAIVSSSGSRSLDQIITNMISEGTGLTKPQAMAYFEKLSQSILNYLELGFSISTPLFKIRPAITGKFNGKTDTFDPARHQINCRITPGLRLRNVTMDVKIDKGEALSQTAVPMTLVVDKVENPTEVVAVGDIAMLKGKRLRFDIEDPKQGLFFESLDNPENVVRVVKYSDMNPSKLHFLIPQLAPGEYKILVKRMSDNGKQLLVGELESTINV